MPTYDMQMLLEAINNASVARPTVSEQTVDTANTATTSNTVGGTNKLLVHIRKVMELGYVTLDKVDKELILAKTIEGKKENAVVIKYLEKYGFEPNLKGVYKIVYSFIKQHSPEVGTLTNFRTNVDTSGGKPVVDIGLYPAAFSALSQAV